jgi:hypothetical protein
LKHRFAIRNAKDHGDNSAHEVLERYKLAQLGGVIRRGHIVDRDVERWCSRRTGEWTERVHEWEWPEDSWVEVEISFEQIRDLICHTAQPLIVDVELGPREPKRIMREYRQHIHTWTWVGDPKARYRITIYDDYME